MRPENEVSSPVQCERGTAGDETKAYEAEDEATREHVSETLSDSQEGGSRMASQVDEGVYSLESVVRGHHVYKRVWSPVMGEQLVLKCEEDNENDSRAVAVLKNDVVVGHMPRETARTVWFFLKRGGTGKCEIIGRRKKGKGLEVPCVYSFSGPDKLVRRLGSLLKVKNFPCSCPY